ncbi:MAG TPA: hypothetical protein VKX25_16215 [Bryobacteraceae bacterium]|jgi:hypothetical protein|nr:hypothetical protein [Bryobacteraceae bacterium]
MPYQENVLIESTAKAVADFLQAIERCVLLFVRAEQEQRISFDDEGVATGLQIVARISASAAELSPERRERYLRHIREHGPAICQDLIAGVQRRSPPVVHSDELMATLLTETEGF